MECLYRVTGLYIFLNCKIPYIYIYIGAAVYQWRGFKSRRGKNKNLTALKSNSNTVWFNFQTYIYISMVWVQIPSREEQKSFCLTALKSNSNTVWFNFQTYICLV
jgi:hypothetical protein